MKLINKNKWSITGTFLTAFLLVIILIFIANIILVFSKVIRTTEISLDNPEKFTRDFVNFIDYKNGSPSVSENGLKELKNRDGWIQILGEDFKEIYSSLKPETIPKSYTPIDLIHSYKYDIDSFSIFIGESKNNNKTYSYIIGMPITRVAKHTLVFSPAALKTDIWQWILLLLSFDILVAVIISYFFFSKRMGKPLEAIIDGIKNLSDGNYEKHHKEQGIYKDVFANLNKLNRILKENKAERKALDNMRDSWISSISHDVKTPLSSIKGYAEIMKEHDYCFSDEEIREYSGIIFEKSSYIQALIEDLNLTYKLKSNNFALSKENVNIVDLIQSMIIEILNHPLYCKRDITLEYEDSQVILFIDKNLIKRALANLIFNAVIHNDEKTRIKVSLVIKNDNVTVSINDDGCGIPKKDLPYIFHRYYRGTNTTSSNEGSGLGLAIAKQIIEAHNGWIDIVSEINEGTIILIKLKYDKSKLLSPHSTLSP